MKRDETRRGARAALSNSSLHVRAGANTGVRAYASAFTYRGALAPLCCVRLLEERLGVREERSVMCGGWGCQGAGDTCRQTDAVRHGARWRAISERGVRRGNEKEWRAMTSAASLLLPAQFLIAKALQIQRAVP